MNPFVTTFQDDLALQLKADLAELLALPSSAVHVGRTRSLAAGPLVVWIRPRDSALADGRRIHRFDVHVCMDGHAGGLDEPTPLAPLLRALELITARYHDARPFTQALPTLTKLELWGHRLDELTHMGSLTLAAGEQL